MSIFIQSNFRIREINQENALAAIQGRGIDDELRRLGWSDEQIDGLEDYDELSPVMFNSFGWLLRFEDSEDVIGIEWATGETDEEDDQANLVLFRAIAPYVEEHSRIVMQDKNGDVWRYVFAGGTCRETYPCFKKKETLVENEEELSYDDKFFYV